MRNWNFSRSHAITRLEKLHFLRKIFSFDIGAIERTWDDIAQKRRSFTRVFEIFLAGDQCTSGGCTGDDGRWYLHRGFVRDKEEAACVSRFSSRYQPAGVLLVPSHGPPSALNVRDMHAKWNARRREHDKRGTSGMHGNEREERLSSGR